MESCSTLLLVFLYYSISLIGVSFAKQGRFSPAAGVWLADFVFLVGGVFLLWQSERRPIELSGLALVVQDLKSRSQRCAQPNGELVADGTREASLHALARGRWRLFNLQFPTILDDYVLRDFALYLP